MEEKRRIGRNVYHLLRGYVFDFCGKKFFSFGGASSHDVDDGILDPEDYESRSEFKKVVKEWQKENKMFTDQRRVLVGTRASHRGRDELWKRNAGC